MNSNSTDEIMVEIPKDKVYRILVCDYYGQKAKGGHGVDAAFLGMPGARIVAVSDPDEHSLEILQKKLEAPKAYADYRKAIDGERPDIVCIGSRLPGNHSDIIVYAAEKGCHIYCEKPMAADLEDSDIMVEAAEKANVRLAVAQLARYCPALQNARNLIEKGEIGRVLSVYCRGREDSRGGGEDMVVLGTHVLDIMRFLVGDPLSVYSDITTDGRRMERADAHDPTEPLGPVAGDEITATYLLPKGVRGYFESRKDMEQKYGDYRMGVTVIGEEGILQFRYDQYREVLIKRGRQPLEYGGDFEHLPPPPSVNVNGELSIAGSTRSLEEYFSVCNKVAALDLMRAIAENRDPLCSGKDARWALEMIHGIYRSHFSGKAETFPADNRRHPLV